MIESTPDQHYKAYWIMALACSAIAVAIDFIERDFRADFLFGLSAIGLYFLVRRGTLSHTRAIPMHMVCGMTLLVWEIHFGLGAATASALVKEAQTTFLTLGCFGLGMFGGIRGFLAGVAAALVAKFNATSPGLTIALTATVGFTGVVAHDALARLNESRDQMKRLAFLDALTGLPNRRAAEVQFATYRAIAERVGSSLTVVVWDLDLLKQVNDSQGHAAGDAYIVDFATALRSCLRAGDSAFRVGGDEFVSMHHSLEDGSVVAERVRKQFAHVSVGWAKSTGEDFSTIQHRADANMYQDKAIRRKNAG
jgi:diguanylate cyclase (GGDEF)-like protein